jgi:hypothetical protein
MRCFNVANLLIEELERLLKIMSTCKICSTNGFPNVTITWKNDSGKYTPLALDGTLHKHIQPNGSNNNNNGHDNPVVTKKPEVKTIPNFDSLNFAEILAEVLQDYVRLKKQEIGAK